MKKILWVLIIITLFFVVIFIAISVQDEYGCPKDDNRDDCFLAFAEENNSKYGKEVCHEIQDF